MKVVVVGGGIAGLVTAYRLHQADSQLRITLVERDRRLGSKIVTVEDGGFIIEGGPDSFLAQQKPWALELVRELGLDLQLLGTNDARRKVYLLYKGKLRSMPDGLMLVVPTRLMPFALTPIISLPGKLRMALDLIIPARRDDSDESLATFITRRLGREALEVLAEPMMAGIHVADPEALSLQATFPRFIDFERKHGSLIRGMVAARKAQADAPPADTSMFVSMRGGLSQLVKALEEALTRIDIVTGQSVSTLGHEGDQHTLALDDGETLLADAVVLATPAYVAADLVAELQPSLAEMLHAIRYVSTATVSLGFKRSDVPHALDGFGFVVPSSEPTKLLACTWTSTKLDQRAPDDAVLLRAFVGGPRNQELVTRDDKHIISVVRQELRKIMGINSDPLVARVFRWTQASPQYDVGHLERVTALEAACPPGLFMTGSPYRGVGIPDCVRQASETAQRVREFIDALQPVSTPIGEGA